MSVKNTIPNLLTLGNLLSGVFGIVALTWHGFPEVARGRRVLELGAGVSLPGITAAVRGAAQVILTDRVDPPEILLNAERAAAENDVADRCSILALSWGIFDESVLNMPQPEVRTLCLSQHPSALRHSSQPRYSMSTGC